MKTAKLIVVCDSCLRSTCIQGMFYCENSKSVGTTEKTVTELLALDREHPSWWERRL